MTTITYTFAADCPVAELRGLTVTGHFCSARTLGPIDTVRFTHPQDGRPIYAKIAGKPELEAAYAAHKAAEVAVAARLSTMGWPAYEAVQIAASNARAAYDKASEYGYPQREAAAMAAADAALDAARAQYPQAALYAQAESYSYASNYIKAAAGRRAMRAIEDGADPADTIAAMDAEWSAAAADAVSRD